MSETIRLDAAADWLQRLQASPQDEQLVSQWIDWCQADPQNLDAFERIEGLWNALGTFAATTQRPTARPHRARYLALAASVLIVIAVTAGWMIQRFGNTARVLTTNVAEHGSQILADGSHVDLGARTCILTRYTETERNVTVEAGEAFFEVAKDAIRPFVVEAGGVRVTAVGTAFSVRLASDRTVVTVSEGQVRIAPKSRDQQVHQVQAGVGEQITFIDSTSNLTLSRVDPKAALVWRDGILRFVDEPLSAVVDDVNRYARHEIVIADPALRNRRYTGTIYRDRIEDWVRALQEVFPIEAVQRGDEIALLVKKKQ